ncbi:hypothetical protein HDU84_008014 [Entophlyctis sp. JEL0112]|nr:hypothetical protein HDU84_008014 [Entophlyctis sp. JEL0112]
MLVPMLYLSTPYLSQPFGSVDGQDETFLELGPESLYEKDDLDQAFDTIAAKWPASATKAKMACLSQNYGVSAVCFLATFIGIKYLYIDFGNNSIRREDVLKKLLGEVRRVLRDKTESNMGRALNDADVIPHESTAVSHLNSITDWLSDNDGKSFLVARGCGFWKISGIRMRRAGISPDWQA